MTAPLDTRSVASAGPPLVLDRYELLEHIAQGGMGEVFRARELATDRVVALKRLLPTALKRKALFRAEYHALARLKHPYIIEVYDYGLDGELPYYTMELLDGYDLRESPSVSVPEGCRILRDVACSLALLHGQRLLHRDVSPRNVRRTHSGVCKLIDFGTMVPFGVPPNLAGTPPFISPEAREGGLLDQRSDLYSLGALAYWLFSRRLPGMARSLEPGAPPAEPPPLLSKVAKGVPEPLEDLVMSLLEFDPSKRPSSAMEVIARLSAIGGLPHDDHAQLAQSHLVSSTFVGQKPAQEQAEKQIKRALSGMGSALLVVGEEGSGKTRFLQEVALSAQVQGMLVLRAYASRSARGAHLTRELYRALVRIAPDLREQLSAAQREALGSFDWQEASATVAQPAETRARLQSALSAYFMLVTKRGPCALLVDDLDLADEFSVAFVSALAAGAEGLPLWVVASAANMPREEGGEHIAPFVGRARCVLLRSLAEKGTQALVSSVFGRVPHRDLLVSYLYKEAHGNPGLTLELCQGLLDRGIIRYMDGAFVLPGREIVAELPARSLEPKRQRLRALSADARSLAELLSLCRGGASLELCLAAHGGRQDEVLSALDELVSRGIVMGSGSEYVFAQQALRRAVRSSLNPERTKELHARLAQAFLNPERGSALQQLEAGWHLVHTDREREGAELLSRVTPPLIESGVAYQDAIAGLEKALEVLERTGCTLEQRLTMRTHLARASYIYDYRLVARYADETLRLLRAWAGTALFNRFQRVLGATLALYISLLWLAVRWLFTPRQRRGPGPVGTLQCLGRSIVSTLGVRVTSLDGPGAMAMLRELDLFSGGGGPLFRAIGASYASASALALQPFGCEAKLARAQAHALKLMAGRLTFMSEAERQDLRVGMWLSSGITECYRMGSKALELADQLQQQGTRIAQAAAHRIRFTYYCVRGMREKSEEYRRELDIHGLQGGTTWQVEWFALPTEGMASALLGDLVGTAHALTRLERLAAEMPSLVPLRDMVRIGLHLRRGEHELAVELGAQFVAAHPPRSVIGWGSAYAAYAAALNMLGRHREALSVCERGLSALEPGDEQFIIMYGPLRRELSLALCGEGRLEEGLASLEGQLQQLAEVREHALLAHAHEVRAAVARMQQDHSLLAQALVAMRDAAEEAGSTTVMEKAAKVTQASLRGTTDVEISVTQESWDSSETSNDATPPRGIARRNQAALLGRLMRRAGARAAFVFSAADNDGEPHLLASGGEALLTPALQSFVSSWLSKMPAEGGVLAHEIIGELSVELVALPAAANARPVLLALLRSEAVALELPTTLLARLAERVRTELSLSPGPTTDSVPDSDSSHPAS